MAMRHQELILGLADQRVYYDVPEGRPDEDSVEAQLFNADVDDDGTPEEALTGATFIDNGSTTLDASFARGDNAITVNDGANLRIGRRYLMENGEGESEWVEVRSKQGGSIGLRHPLANDYEAGDTIASTRVSAAVDDEWVADATNITEWQAGHAGYRIRWTYTIDGEPFVGFSYVDLVRYGAKNLVTALDVDARWPGWMDRLPSGYQEDQGRLLVEEAFQAVRMDALGDEQVLRRIRNTEILRELVIHRANVMAWEASRTPNMDALTVAREAYQTRYNQLLREPKVPVDQGTGGASGAAQRLPIWRR